MVHDTKSPGFLHLSVNNHLFTVIAVGYAVDNACSNLFSLYARLLVLQGFLMDHMLLAHITAGHLEQISGDMISTNL